ncbi:MAG: MBOAT family O-acyltransferase [Candidatus Limivicinus sp.]|jgi:alginate O-acetyltransferase complex protein AlgI
MLFSSVTFLYFFLPITLGLYYLLPWKLKNYVLLVSSIIFYASGEPKYVLLLLLAALVGWLHGLGLEKRPGNKWILGSGLFWNLIFLLFFKYADFLIGSLNSLLGTKIPLTGLTLPIGISFYTFQNMSYILDVYWGRCSVQKSLGSYATYLCLFPQLIAGPIVRYSDVERELSSRSIAVSDVSEGAVRFVTGLGKKVLIANTLGELAEMQISGGSVLFSWMRAVSFTLQIYFDFSGYSDMAIGMGRMMGFHFPENFNYPFLSRSATEFWRRWHISLGSWFRDYVYIPMGGSRTGRLKWLRNVLVVWMLTGIWHGANWNFLIWGLYYGLFLLIEKFWLSKHLKGRVMPYIYMFFVTICGFVIFHSAGISDAAGELAGMFGLGGLPLSDSVSIYYLKSYGILIAAALIGSTPLPKKLGEKLASGRAGKVLQPLFILALLILVTAYLVDGSFNPFLYFRF